MPAEDKPAFVPALGRSGLTAAYDTVIALMTRERRWRTVLLDMVGPEGDDVIVDFGAGTGSLAIGLKRQAPSARVIGVDPDAEVLAVAHAKAQAAAVEIEWAEAMGDRVDFIPDDAATKVVSSLVLHQCDLPVKQAILKSMARVLRPQGRIFIADYGLQRTYRMRLLFRQVQALDGWKRAGLNAKGILPKLIVEAGFVEVAETRMVSTPTGSISLYAGRKPGR